MNITTTRHFTVLETNSLLPYSPRNGWLREDSLVLYHHHSRGCRASLYTIEDQIVSCKTEHNHESVAMPSRDLNTYSSMRYKFEKSTKGTRVLVIDGYRFNSRSKSNKSFYAKVMWRCSRNRAGCKVCAYTFEDQLLVVKKQHNHPPPRNSSYGFGSTTELK
ncbi:hypothetical protein MSG28_008206 [Choristoneura fumiferana]|uniref:Uncharacterized protein n=1 Tax=Choristoneura fumiferana TaxID=7141 RepID=A0ACC0JAS1_CHOFU|nr:hypothetical protein MSG28_008206 [Choristoneura fumiferana]